MPTVDADTVADDLSEDTPATRSGDVVDRVAEVIRQRIIAGQLAPGVRISQADFADELHVSRTPLREALHKLASEGLVVAQANRGMRVAPAPLYQVEDAYALRLLTEPPVVRSMAQDISDEHLGQMEEHLKVMESSQGTREFQDAHFAYHRVLTGRYPKTVNRLVNRQLTAILRHQRLYFARPRALTDFTEADRSFLQAVNQRSGDAAGRIMEFHLLDAAVGLIHEVEPYYNFDALLVITDGIGITLNKRSDGRMDAHWREEVPDVNLPETSNLVPHQP